MLGYKIKKIYRPEIFQGHNKKVNYFEGWYFKLIDKKTDNIFAVIPGISISNVKNNSHAFIQVMDGKNSTSEYFRFNFSDFNYSTEKFEIRIGSNFFSLNNLKLNINQDLKIIKADLKFFGLNLWPKSFLAPGAMDGRISESIDAIINVKLQKKVKNNNKEELIYEGTGYNGGLEIINPEVLK